MDTTVQKISLQKIDISARGDIYCSTCFYRAIVVVEAPWANVWRTYPHPHFDKVQNTAGYQHLKYLTPNAIKFVLNHLDAFICPRCNKVGLLVNPGSQYNPITLLQSFKLCS